MKVSIVSAPNRKVLTFAGLSEGDAFVRLKAHGPAAADESDFRTDEICIRSGTGAYANAVSLGNGASPRALSLCGDARVKGVVITRIDAYTVEDQ